MFKKNHGFINYPKINFSVPRYQTGTTTLIKCLFIYLDNTEA
jgi:hypothetical protein